ncbi:hypothetical protein FRACYDRAFT_238227 [Fragilariopsis cylindrus CCMP1102]|uniref:Uncharacterized protein n=1 Tax=Fragilariopsis cylindrus CCMP1102 TaxID=635003 RepID=A0A1E7FI01_9STRA|nr:hypothetical protein FRACYDRAFT_238227 [Fragilariopsis cylindrus CCMP1102]|eukprot:OEU17801.1 hypothetical protein FRACYDRAFT_238227 [Fragilariopsis cylindrus CCMP1102]
MTSAIVDVLRDDLHSAIEDEDWTALGATAALIAVASFYSSSTAEHEADDSFAEADAILDALHDDLHSAIEAEDWAAVGATAALIAVASDSSSTAEHEADGSFVEWEEVHQEPISEDDLQQILEEDVALNLQQISQTLDSLDFLDSTTNSNTAIIPTTTTTNSNTTTIPINGYTIPDPDPDNSDQRQFTTTNGAQPSIVRVRRLRLPSWLRSVSRGVAAPVRIQLATHAQRRRARHRARRSPSTVRCPYCMAMYCINDNTVIVQTRDNHGNDVNMDCPICTEENQLAYNFHKCCHQGICLPCAGHQNIALPL